jgi:hypothetical protein
VTEVPVIDVHAHVLLPGVDEAVAGQPGLRAAGLAGSDLHAVRGGNAADLLGLR